MQLEIASSFENVDVRFEGQCTGLARERRTLFNLMMYFSHGAPSTVPERLAIESSIHLGSRVAVYAAISALASSWSWFPVYTSCSPPLQTGDPRGFDLKCFEYLYALCMTAKLYLIVRYFILSIKINF